MKIKINKKKVKIDKKLSQNILIYYFGYVTPNGIKSLYAFFINKKEKIN